MIALLITGGILVFAATILALWIAQNYRKANEMLLNRKDEDWLNLYKKIFTRSAFLDLCGGFVAVAYLFIKSPTTHLLPTISAAIGICALSLVILVGLVAIRNTHITAVKAGRSDFDIF